MTLSLSLGILVVLKLVVPSAQLDHVVLVEEYGYVVSSGCDVHLYVKLEAEGEERHAEKESNASRA
jgi:hypothetical protein